MEQGANHDWLEDRYDLRAELFNDLTRDVLIRSHLGVHSLAGVATITGLKHGRTSEDDAQELMEVESTVSAVLAVHNQLSLAQDEGTAFSFVDADSQTTVTNITTEVVKHWARVCQRAGLQSPFLGLAEQIMDQDIDNRGARLIIEAASGVCEVLSCGYRQGAMGGQERRRLLIAFVARYGPDFADRWAKGDVIREHCVAASVDPEPILACFTRSRLMELGVVCAKNPIEAVLKEAHNLQTVLSTTNIAKSLDWDEETVERFFPHSTRRYIVRTHLRQPLAKIRQAVLLFNGDMHPASLAKELEWPPSRVLQIFSPSVCMQLCIRNSRPLDRVKRIAHRLDNVLTMTNFADKTGLPYQEIEELVTPKILSLLAFTPHDPLELLQNAVRHLKTDLTPDSIAASLGWEPQKVDQVFTRGRLKLIAFLSPQPARRLKVIGNAHLDLESQYPTLSPAIRAHIAFTHPKNASQYAQAIIEAIQVRPKAVSDTEWAWAIIVLPGKSDHHRLDYIMKRRLDNRLRLSIARPRPFDTVNDTNSQCEHMSGSSSFADPEEQVLETDPSQHLETMASLAGVSQSDLALLLAYMRDDGDLENAPPELMKHFDALRRLA